MATVPNGDPFVVSTLRQAGAQALRQGAPEAAVAYLRRALDEPPALAERADVLYELGVAELNTDASAAMEHLERAVEEIDDIIRRPDVALGYLRALVVLGRHQAANDLLRSTSDLFRDIDPQMHWRLEGRLIIWSQFDPELYTLAKQRLSMIDPRELSGGVGAGVLLGAWAIVEARRGVSRVSAIDYAERALASRAFEEPGERLNVISPLRALMLAGEVEQAARGYDAAILSAQNGGDLLTPAALQLFRGRLRSERGELLAAEEDLRPLDQAAFHSSPDFQAYRAAFLAEVLLERGETDEAEALVTPPIAANPGYRIDLLVARGRVRLETARPEQALADFLEAGSIATAAEIEDPAFAPWRSLAAFALHRLGRRSEAVELAREELARSRTWGAPRTIGVSLRALGLLEGGQTGELLLREAVEVLADSPARLEHARALVDLGAQLRRDNSRSEARKLLRHGVELAHQCSATALVTRGNDELAATGAPPRTILLSGLDALTASERRVAQMAADDLSNKEIAQTLFVTVKTVEQHLGRVYRKLEIDSRRQLATALARQKPRRLSEPAH